jgi:hypothetical protein
LNIKLVLGGCREPANALSSTIQFRFMATTSDIFNAADLDANHREQLKRYASQLKGHERRAFQASVALKYCQGKPGQTEKLFGWGRQAVALGLNELRTNIRCLNACAAFSGNKLWEEKYPEAAKALWAIAQSYAQKDIPVPGSKARFGRITAIEAIHRLRVQGFAEATLPSITTMTAVLNRNGYKQCRLGAEALDGVDDLLDRRERWRDSEIMASDRVAPL